MVNKDELNDLTLVRYLEYVQQKDKDNKEDIKELKKKSKEFFDFILKEKRGETDWDEQLEEYYAPLYCVTASSAEGTRVLRNEIIKKEIVDYLNIFNPELLRRLNSRIKQAYLHALPEALIINKEMENAREDHIRKNIKGQGIVSVFSRFGRKKKSKQGEWTE